MLLGWNDQTLRPHLQFCPAEHPFFAESPTPSSRDPIHLDTFAPSRTPRERTAPYVKYCQFLADVVLGGLTRITH